MLNDCICFLEAVARLTGRELKAYAKAGAVADEVLSAIRTVAAFGGEAKEADRCHISLLWMVHSLTCTSDTAFFFYRYDQNLAEAQSWGIKKGTIIGVFHGYLWCIILLCFGLTFWYGSKLVIDTKELSPGSLVQVRISIASNRGVSVTLIWLFSGILWSSHGCNEFGPGFALFGGLRFWSRCSKDHL